MREKLPIQNTVKPFTDIVFEIVSVNFSWGLWRALFNIWTVCTSCIVKPRAVNEKILPSTSLRNIVRNHKESTYMSILFYRINYIQEMWLMNWWRINKLLIFFQILRSPLGIPWKSGMIPKFFTSRKKLRSPTYIPWKKQYITCIRCSYKKYLGKYLITTCCTTKSTLVNIGMYLNILSQQIFLSF